MAAGSSVTYSLSLHDALPIWKAPEATCQAMRWVMVVVLPVPAPARIATGPVAASAARRCSAFRRPRTVSGSSMSGCYPPARTPLALAGRRLLLLDVDAPVARVDGQVVEDLQAAGGHERCRQPE